MRDYGTGTWEGGNQDCDHVAYIYSGVPGHACGKCGARRVDNQLGLEPTPDLYVARMVEVFREVRRVLAKHGTCWVNMGDSYVSQGGDGRAGFNGQVRVDQLNKDQRVRPQDGLKSKDLVGMPWRLAFALQADGWVLRADIIWAKPNPMPESVTDRPTKAHEYVFMLTKRPRYWFDQEAVREPWGDHGRDDMRSKGVRTGLAYLQQEAIAHNSSPQTKTKKLDGWATHDGGHGSFHRDGRQKGEPNFVNASGRNIRSVWEIATQPYPEAHFATYPEELVRRCLLAGCAAEVCRECGKSRERIVQPHLVPGPKANRQRLDTGRGDSSDGNDQGSNRLRDGHLKGWTRDDATLGWSDCGHGNYRPGIVLDPFVGSGTTALVARNHGRHAIGIDLRADYLELAARRLQQLSLLAETR